MTAPEPDAAERTFKKICRLAGKAVADYKMIGDSDRILVGLSGGKDSMTLLRVLRRLADAAPVRFTVAGATFDPMFPGFSASETADFCRSLGFEHHIVRFDMASLLAEKGLEGKPCMLCSRIRRGTLYTLAEKLGCGKLALGQHLDDVCVSFLMSLFRGNGLSTMGPNVPAEERPLRIIRPLVYVPEQLVADYAAAAGFPKRGECLYRAGLEASGDRFCFRRLLETLSERIPDLRSNMLRSLSNLQAPFLLDPAFLEIPDGEGGAPDETH